MKRWLLGMAGCLLAGAALAGDPGAVRKQVEASMVVTGSIGVTQQGTVRAYTIDHPEKLPPLIIDLIGKSVPRWTFQPVLRDGRPVVAKANMSLRLVARPTGDGKFEIAVRSAYFGDDSHGIRQDKSTPPRYPKQAIRGRVEGTVYLALRVDREGNVADVAAQQVNLRVVAGDNEMKRWRDVFAKATVDAARAWTFTPAEASDHALYRDVRVPVSYELSEGPIAKKPVYGQWETYVPGPQEPVPWSDTDRMLTGGVDALPGDGVYGAPSLSLLTPLDRG
jgi:Gram-negative bacterial TonB protein C-terminal